MKTRPNKELWVPNVKDKPPYMLMVIINLVLQLDGFKLAPEGELDQSGA
jgi:hypothetical protein